MGSMIVRGRDTRRRVSETLESFSCPYDVTCRRVAFDEDVDDIGRHVDTTLGKTVEVHGNEVGLRPE